MRAMCAPRQTIGKTLVGYRLSLNLSRFVAKTPIHKIIKGHRKPVVLGKEGTKDPTIAVATVTEAVGTRLQTNIKTNTNNSHSQAHCFKHSRRCQHK